MVTGASTEEKAKKDKKKKRKEEKREKKSKATGSSTMLLRCVSGYPSPITIC